MMGQIEAGLNKKLLYYNNFSCFRMFQDGAGKLAKKPLLTGWSLVRIRPGEPNSKIFRVFQSSQNRLICGISIQLDFAGCRSTPEPLEG
ncbi:hypothetical protein MPLA_320049 [Mesorhizobium sp. ORS 3359]|nr:hypothetical protein MPLA_320049 [Mesorhizobium sp. ORS 3359]